MHLITQDRMEEAYHRIFGRCEMVHKHNTSFSSGLCGLKEGNLRNIHHCLFDRLNVVVHDKDLH